MGPVETRPEFDRRVKLRQLARVVDYQALLPSSLLSLARHLDAYCFALCHALVNEPLQFMTIRIITEFLGGKDFKIVENSTQFELLLTFKIRRILIIKIIHKDLERLNTFTFSFFLRAIKLLFPRRESR